VRAEKCAAGKVGGGRRQQQEAEDARTRYPTNSLKSPLDFCRPFGGGKGEENQSESEISGRGRQKCIQIIYPPLEGARGRIIRVRARAK